MASEVKEWQECDDSASKCIAAAAAAEANHVDLPIRYRTVCGDLVLAIEAPSPWAFREFDEAEFNVEKFARVVVPCRS